MRLPSCSAVLLATALLAPVGIRAADQAAGAVPGPLLDLQVPSGATLQSHWQASIYAKLWNDPALAPLRDQAVAALSAFQQGHGFDPIAALADSLAMRFQILGLGATAHDVHPQMLFQDTLPTLSGTIFSSLLAANPHQPAHVPGAQSAVSIDPQPEIGPLILASIGHALLAGVNLPDSSISVTPITASDHDFTTTVRFGDIFPQIVSLLPPGSPLAKPDFAERMGFAGRTIVMSTDIVPEGLLEHGVLNGVEPYWPAFDLDLMKRLPSTTLLSLGAGCDLGARWKGAYRDDSLRSWGTSLHLASTAPEDVARELNADLAKFGLATTVDDLIRGVKGTFIFAVGAGSPFPTLTIVLPRSTSMDTVVGWAAQHIGAVVPVVGTSSPIAVPDLPLPIQLACDTASWVITSDPLLTDGWLAHRSGGWGDSGAGKLALSRLSGDALAIATSDTPSVLRTVASYAGLVLAGNRTMAPAQKAAILVGLNHASTLVSPGYAVVWADHGSTRTESRGLLSASVMGLMAVGTDIAKYPLFHHAMQNHPHPGFAPGPADTPNF